jgi:23S rRNA-/tRNA-specific pseudouridylate synthase
LQKRKKGGKVRSVISRKGEEALTKVEPILVSGKRSKVKIVIETGRTHQIRVHLSSIGHSIIGDEVYGGEQFERTLLHHKKIELLGKSFEAPEPSLFKRFEN